MEKKKLASQFAYSTCLYFKLTAITQGILYPFHSPTGLLIDFTLSNARRFYLSIGNSLGVKGLTLSIVPEYGAGLKIGHAFLHLAETLTLKKINACASAEQMKKSMISFRPIKFSHPFLFVLWFCLFAYSLQKQRFLSAISCSRASRWLCISVLRTCEIFPNFLN